MATDTEKSDHPSSSAAESEPSSPGQPHVPDECSVQPRLLRRVARRALSITASPLVRLKEWVDRRRDIIDLRDRGRNAGLGIRNRSTRRDGP